MKDRQNADDNATEVANNIYGDILTENPAVAQSAFGAHRVIPDRWKGMSPEQLADIKRTQELQAREKKVHTLLTKYTIILIVTNVVYIMHFIYIIKNIYTFKRMDEEAKRREAEWDRQREAQARAGTLLEREKDRRQKDMKKQLDDENRRLAMEQNGHNEYMNKAVYTNKPTAAYFQQFNTTTR